MKMTFPPALTPSVALNESVWFLSGNLGDGEDLRQVPINTVPFRIGRRADLNLSLPSPQVSKLHAEIFAANGGLGLRDLESASGTFLNGQRVRSDQPIGRGDLIQFADYELEVGRQSVERADQHIASLSAGQGWLVTQFERLLKDQAVLPFFQPIVDMRDESTIGYEVLARSNLKGLEVPREMFYTASRLNREAELSEVCRSRGVAVGAQLPGNPALFLNTHPAEQLLTGVLSSLRLLRLQAPGLPLVLEIHEASVTAPEEMQEFRDALNELDIKLAYDDFGAGTARIKDLAKVPPDYLKFDMAMIQGIHLTCNQERQVVRTLVQVARDFGIAVLAEGIECVDEAEVCRALGFDYAQGFYFGRPAPREGLAPPVATLSFPA